MNSLNSGVTGIALLANSGNVLISKNISFPNDSISLFCLSGNYFLRVTGNSGLNPNLNSHKFIFRFSPVLSLNITAGIEGMRSDSVQVQDTLKIYLTNSNAPYNNLDSSNAFLNNSGNAIVDFINAAGGNYYLRIVHRNALETWSSSQVNFIPGTITDFDFTLNQTTAYGNNLVLKSGRWCFYSGDIDRNGSIDLSDIIGIYNDASAFITGYNASDLTGDNLTDLTDIVIAYNNSVNFVSVIKP